ncbi:MAG: hypothetical protein J2P20_03635, partial [Pseudonocardia sp.]|nr:hypothetical protein [Pseudonocardia sp.]
MSGEYGYSRIRHSRVAQVGVGGSDAGGNRLRAVRARSTLAAFVRQQQGARPHRARRAVHVASVSADHQARGSTSVPSGCA